MNKALREELMRLSPAERIELAMDLWDSIEPQDMPPPTAEVIEECERRLAEHRADPTSALPWEDVKAWLWSRRK
jgi:putative addiction module component (TIGR02574 family)